MKKKEFTLEDLNICWPDDTLHYCLQVLNGEYDLEKARADLRTLREAHFDKGLPLEVFKQLQRTKEKIKRHEDDIDDLYDIVDCLRKYPDTCGLPYKY